MYVSSRFPGGGTMNAVYCILLHTVVAVVTEYLTL